MNIKMFAAIVSKAAAAQSLWGGEKMAAWAEHVVARLKRHGAKPLPKFFIVDSANRETSQSSEEGMSAAMFGKLVRGTAEILRAAGSAAKANELAQAANDLEEHGDVPAVCVLDAIEAEEEAAKTRQIEHYVRRLAGSESDQSAFDEIVQEVGKLNAQIAIQVAVQYVAGRTSYPSKPKAISAIRNKQYAQERFRDKINRS